MVPKIIYFIIIFSVSSYSECIKFMAFGDWGGVPFFPYKTFVELAVGREMAQLSSHLNIDFILSLGDNFYLDGVKNVDDPRFKETYESAFDYESLHIPWFVVAGNHDHYGNVSAQIAYSSRSDRWFFPDFYYKKFFKIPSSNCSVDLLMIDTIILCGNTNPKDPFAPPILDMAFKHQSENHWKWLEDALKSSKANYIFVCGHYPVYSIGSHGPTKCLVSRLKPLLEKYQVSAYFSGHDHNMQHIQVQNNISKTDYFVTGSGGFIDPSKKHADEIPPGSLLFHWVDPFSLGAFSYVDVNSKNMTVSFIYSSGKYMYSYTKEPRF